MKIDAYRAHRARHDLGEDMQPRPWRCSTNGARFCTLHGDCTCSPASFDPACPHHRPGSDHPHGERLVDRPLVADNLTRAAFVNRADDA